VLDPSAPDLQEPARIQRANDALVNTLARYMHGDMLRCGRAILRAGELRNNTLHIHSQFTHMPAAMNIARAFGIVFVQ
jgi:hypothetical protein